MNIFRLTGDMSHLIAIIILLIKIWKTRSCSGVSGKSQIMFALVFAARYLDLFSSFVSAYNSIMKVLFLVGTFITVYLMWFKFKATNDHNHDTFRFEFLIGPCAILAFIVNHEFSFLEILWTFSIYLEAVAILPQLFMISKTGEAESITSHYLFALGSYRGLYILNWIYRYYAESFFDLIAVVSGCVQTILYCDFFYLYITKESKDFYSLSIMCSTEKIKYRSNRAASIHCISGSLLSRKSSQDLSSWRSGYYFHGKEIGRGHFSKVYHVTDLMNNKEGAIKVIRRRRGGIDRIQIIRQEIKIMQDLISNNIQSVIKLYYVHESLIEVALVMELAKGGCLFDVVRESKNPLPENYVQQVIKQLLSALIAMHLTNIVHLDIKADNILLREPYPSTDIALCDFGLATQLSSERIHRELVGTPDYIAPEIINYEEISVFTDMWSLGVLTYYLLTSESPFMGETKEMTLLNVSKLNYHFSEDKFNKSLETAKDFISKLIVKKPNMRLSALEADRHRWLQSVVISNDLESLNQKSDLEIQEESKSLSSDSGYESCL